MGLGFRRSSLLRIATILIILLSIFQTLVATRLPDGDTVLQLQSLQQCPVTPFERSGCTNRPNNGGGICPIKSKKVEGLVPVAPPAFPGVVIDFDRRYCFGRQ
uniref:Uncharacterized protein n=1 Tax=Nelumbo nucifera TaxID=4432 RepID=A0A822YNF6_NELNU|nr:TPA_asm: hypothetical protein HUJ06_004770 [Nelumbo nucifera]